MFSKAVLATDLSQVSDKIVQCSQGLKGMGVKEIILTYVAQSFFTPGLDDMLAKEAGPRIEEQKQILAHQGFNVKTIIEKGVPWYKILEVANSAGADLLVVGSHGHGAVADTLLGGTATQLLEQAHMPILLLRTNLVQQQGRLRCDVRLGDPLKHVLFPTDFSPASNKAFSVLLELAPGCEAVTLLHVHGIRPCLYKDLEKDLPNEHKDQEEMELNEMADRLIAIGCPQVSSSVSVGCVKKTIMEEAARQGVSLLIMASRGWGLFKELRLGSISRAVVNHASVPVLLIKGDVS